MSDLAINSSSVALPSGTLAVGEMLTPSSVYVNDPNVASFYFADAHAGKAVILGIN